VVILHARVSCMRCSMVQCLMGSFGDRACLIASTWCFCVVVLRSRTVVIPLVFFVFASFLISLGRKLVRLNLMCFGVPFGSSVRMSPSISMMCTLGNW